LAKFSSLTAGFVAFHPAWKYASAILSKSAAVGLWPAAPMAFNSSSRYWADLAKFSNLTAGAVAFHPAWKYASAILSK